MVPDTFSSTQEYGNQDTHIEVSPSVQTISFTLLASRHPGESAGDQFGTKTLFPTSAGDEIGSRKNVDSYTRREYQGRDDPAPELPD